jgi:hypothetical protein
MRVNDSGENVQEREKMDELHAFKFEPPPLFLGNDDSEDTDLKIMI